MTGDYTAENENMEDFVVNNKRSLKKLERAIQMSQGQFSLILMCCNCSSMRRRMVKQLSKRCSIQIQELILHPSVTTLFTTILTAIEEPPPQALMVFGLESVVAIDQLLNATNLVRDEFPKHFPFPLILCINDEILQKLIRLAPDFKSWAANPIRFEDPKNHPLAATPITA
jgi:hypothetical protein